MSDLPPTLNKRALLKLHFTPGLVELLLGKPDLEKHHKKGICHWTEHLYARDRVVAAMREPQFLSHLDKRKAREASAARRQAAIPEKYAAWKDALPEACAGMFSLNRYAKHRSCSELHKVEIYRLKNELIEVLYRNGYATEAWIHRLTQDALACRECGGAGGGDCDCCDGTGVYRAARTLEFWCFRFLIAGKAYCWHQPRHLVEFAPAETVPPQDWDSFSPEEKPVALPKHKFAAVKELLRWVVDRASAADVETPPAEVTSSSPPVFPPQTPPSHHQEQQQETLPF